MASNLLAMASNLTMASNLLAMASNLREMASNRIAMALLKPLLQVIRASFVNELRHPLLHPHTDEGY